MCVCVEEGRDKENERAEKRGASRKEHESQKILIKIKKEKKKRKSLWKLRRISSAPRQRLLQPPCLTAEETFKRELAFFHPARID